MRVYKKLGCLVLLLVSMLALAQQLPRALLKINGQRIPVELAITSAAQQQGLSDRLLLPKRTGMYFFFSSLDRRTFWMKDMNFPLDIIWIRQGEVVGVTANVPRPISKTEDLRLYPSPGLVDGVLELNAGEAAKLNIRLGDKMALEKLGAAVPGP